MPKKPSHKSHSYSERVEETAAAYLSGESVANISSRLGVDRQTVYERLWAADVTPLPGRPWRFRLGDLSIIYKMITDGATDREIAEKFGCSRAAIRYWRKKLRKRP